MAVSQKHKYTIIICPRNSISWHIPKRIKSKDSNKYLWTLLFIALFTIAKIGSNQGVYGQKNTLKIWYIHTVKYYSALKFRGTWVAQSVKRWTFDFGSGNDLTVHEIGPHVGLTLTVKRQLGILSLCPPSLPSPQINKHFKKKRNLVTCYNMHESWKHYAKWNKPSQKNKYCMILPV